MDQKPVPGQDALVPPSPDVAQQYLDEAQAVAARREHAVDRRALAWLQIGNAVITAVFLVASAVVLRGEVLGGSQVLLFAFLMWGQLASGIAQRSGMQWRMTRSRWPVVVGGALILVAALVAYGFAIWDRSLPPLVILLPGVIVLIGLGGYGIVQLIRAGGDPRRSPVRSAPMTRSARVGTILVGAAIGALVLLGGAPEGVLRSVLVLLVMLALLVWIIAGRSDLGLPAIGAAWRWPHIVAFAISASPLFALAVLASAPGRLLVSMIAGLGVILLSVAASFVPGRDLRE